MTYTVYNLIDICRIYHLTLVFTVLTQLLNSTNSVYIINIMFFIIIICNKLLVII